jgi:hypothetical protein
MFKSFFLLFTLAMSSLSFAQHHDHALTNSKIAHDASHRIGRLADMGRIDEVFMKNMKSIEVNVLPHGEHTGKAYSVIIKAGSKAETVLTFDPKGKFLSNKVVSTSPSETAPWVAFSSELLESALHFIMEANDSNINSKVFSNNLKKAILKQQQNDDGTVNPVVVISSSVSSKLIQVVLSVQGNVISYSIIE